MAHHPIRRRQFVADTVRLALGARAAALLGALTPAAVAAASGRAFDEHDAATLVALARALLPHPALEDRYYVEVARQFDVRAAGDTAFHELVSDGIRRLDALADGSWVDRDVDRKLAVLEQVQSEPFFGAVLNATIDVLYRNPEVQRHLGYEGSSLEYGGYLGRGFDDIDWLPE